MPDALMLFAAGFGTRMGALTATRPKALIEVAGKPLLDHALEMADTAGVSHVVVNTHYLADQIGAHLSGRAGIAISHETPEILETGGGLQHALPLFNGRDAVLTLNSDAIWTGENPLTSLLKSWDPRRMDALLTLVPPEQAGDRGGGDFQLLPDGRLQRGAPFTYGGAQIIKTAAVARHPAGAFSMNAVWDRLIAQGTVHGVVHEGGWCDVGKPEGIAAAEALLAAAT